MGAAIAGGLSSLAGGDKAVDAQKRAASEANATQRYVFDQTRQDQEPYRAVGMRALAGLEDPNFQKSFSAADFANYKDPGYDMRMQEGMKAINNAASARGMGNSGATMKALAKYGQDYASNEYQNMYNRFNNDQGNRFSRLSSLAGMGQDANRANATVGMNYGNQVSGNQIGLGNAIASNHIAKGNMFNNMLGQGMSMAGMAFGGPMGGAKAPSFGNPQSWASYGGSGNPYGV